ncbi:MAG TPA: hypothetical protein VF384_11540 [Planctomycetota bacterium]
MEAGSASRAHADCSFCAARMAARNRLAPLLAKRPAVPDELSAVVTVDAVFARIVEQSSQSRLGSLLDRGMSISPPAGEEVGWPQPLLESTVGRLIPVTQSANSPAAWAQVRRAILASVSTGMPQFARRWWMLGVASAAAVAIASTMLFGDAQESPSIVFADLDQAPRVEFAVLRQGVLR